MFLVRILCLIWDPSPPKCSNCNPAFLEDACQDMQIHFRSSIVSGYGCCSLRFELLPAAPVISFETASVQKCRFLQSRDPNTPGKRCIYGNTWNQPRCLDEHVARDTSSFLIADSCWRDIPFHSGSSPLFLQAMGAFGHRDKMTACIPLPQS